MPELSEYQEATPAPEEPKQETKPSKKPTLHFEEVK
jgi:hypothetical protein